MILHSVSGEYFRSIGAKQTFYFGQEDGLYLISGRNLKHKKMGANAVGKSAILDLLSWTLYGRTARNLSAEIISNWSGEGTTSGAVELALGGRYYTIRRTWSPNSLTIQRKGKVPRVITQEVLDKRLGLNHASFLAVVLMGQFNDFFFDLKPAEKLDIFSDVLQLEFWQKQAEKARSESETCDADIRASEIAIAKTGAKINVLSQLVVSAKKRIGDYDSKKKEQLRLLNRRVRKLESYIWKERKAQRSRSAKLDYVSTTRRRLERILADDDVRLQKMREELHRWDKRIAVQRNEIKLLRRRGKGRCPTCGQRLALKSLSRFRGKRKRLDGSIMWSKKQFAEATVKEKYIRKGITQVMNKLKLADSEYNSLRAGGDPKFHRLSQEFEDKSRRVKQLVEETNPHREGLRAARIAVMDAKAHLKALRRKIAVARRHRRAAGFWVTAFRDIRLWLIDESLQQLEIEVGNALRAIGLDGWKVTFEIERITQSGGVSRGFHVMIQSPESQKPVRWEAWSGGETQRLRIAGACGLAELIRRRTGIAPNVEIWDEPTQWMSQQGIEQLLAFLESRANEEERQVWLVDHRSLKAGNFAGQVRIEMTPDAGTKVIGGRGYHYGRVA